MHLGCTELWVGVLCCGLSGKLTSLRLLNIVACTAAVYSASAVRSAAGCCDAHSRMLFSKLGV
jgi:hypothetical protein